MRRKSAAEILREVSPGLTVIPGGVYPHGPKRKAVRLAEQPKPELPYYVPHKATEEEWEKAGGEICPVCGNEAVRLIPYGYAGKRKACPACVERRRNLFESKARVLSSKRARSARNAETNFRLLLIKYNNRRT